MLKSLNEYRKKASMLASWKADVAYWEGTIQGYRDAVRMLGELEQMEERQKYAAWLYQGDGFWECERCHNDQPCQTPHCPECGAEMISDE